MLFFLSILLTGLVRYYALSRQVLDIPNNRSSHTIPTPRGGGVAFVVVFLVYFFYLGISGAISIWEALCIAASGILVAGLGFVDDHRPISAKLRLVGHFVACGFVLFCMGGMKPLIPIEWHIASIELLFNLFALFYLVWLLNLYNFMDGIDGLAAVEAITVCLGAGLIYFLQGHEAMMTLPLVLAVVVAGFLVWNFPIARIFMGDVGSGFLGLLIGVLSIQAANVQSEFFWSWLILLGVFIVDATVTLLRRVYHGSPIAEAHRQHAYQRAVDVFHSHIKVTVGVLVINLIWLLPLAVLVGNGHLNGLLGLLIAYLPLIVLVYSIKFNDAL